MSSTAVQPAAVARSASSRRAAFVLVALLLSALAASRPASAADSWYVAPGGNDNNSCQSSSSPCRSIAAALDLASAGDSIHLAAGTYAERLVVDKRLVIIGAGAQQTILEAGSEGRALELKAGSQLMLQGVTLQNGVAPIPQTGGSFGGGVLNAGSLELVNIIIRDNHAHMGAGVYNANGASLTLSSSTVSSNNADTGAGVYNANGASLTLSSSTVSSNSADWMAGGVYNATGATLVLHNSTISANTSREGAGIYNAGLMSMTGSTVRSNQVAISEAGWDQVYSLASGGGIYNSGSLTAVNSTISENGVRARAVTYGSVKFGGYAYANAQGGGLYNSGTLLLLSTTVVRNSAEASANDETGAQASAALAAGGGLYSTAEVTSTLGHTILGQNTLWAAADTAEETVTTGPDCWGPLTSRGYVLLQDIAACTLAGDTSSVITADPRLAPLAAHGGPTHTNALIFNSPAIDAGSPDGCPDAEGQPLTLDQRGAARPIDGDNDGQARCDIGAFEAPNQPFRIYLPSMPHAVPAQATSTAHHQ